jgi:hypothetical protein
VHGSREGALGRATPQQRGPGALPVAASPAMEPSVTESAAPADASGLPRHEDPGGGGGLPVVDRRDEAAVGVEPRLAVELEREFDLGVKP